MNIHEELTRIKTLFRSRHGVVKPMLSEQSSATYNKDELSKLVANVKSTSFGEVASQKLSLKGINIENDSYKSWSIQTGGKNLRTGKMGYVAFFCSDGKIFLGSNPRVDRGNIEITKTDFNFFNDNWKSLCPPFPPQPLQKREINNTNKTGVSKIQTNTVPVQFANNKVYFNYGGGEYEFDCSGVKFYKMEDTGVRTPLTPPFIDASGLNEIRKHCK